MAFSRMPDPYGTPYLSTEVKTMIVEEVLKDAGMSLAASRPVQMSLLHTSTEFCAITRRLMADQTYWLRYALCSCIVDAISGAGLVEISDSRRPTYAPYIGDRPNGPTLTISACKCNSRKVEHIFLVPYQTRAMIRTSQLLGDILTNPLHSWLRLSFNGVDDSEYLDCVQESFELQSMLIRHTSTNVETCSDIVASSFIGARSWAGIGGSLPEYTAMYAMLEYATDALRRQRYLEIIDLFCISQRSRPQNLSLYSISAMSSKSYNTFQMLHSYMAQCAVDALTELLEHRPVRISTGRIGKHDMSEISQMARKSMCQYEYLSMAERLKVIRKGAKLVHLMAQNTSLRRTSVYTKRRDIIQAMADLRDGVSYFGLDPSNLLGSDTMIEDCCRKYPGNPPKRIIGELERPPRRTQKIRCWKRASVCENFPTIARDLYNGLLTNLEGGTPQL